MVGAEGGAMSVSLLLYLIAFIFLLLAALGVAVPRVSVGWLGLALWLLAERLLGAF
jgi:hypothetical protein